MRIQWNAPIEEVVISFDDKEDESNLFSIYFHWIQLSLEKKDQEEPEEKNEEEEEDQGKSKDELWGR